MEVDAASNSAGVSLQCHFQSGVTGTASCLVRYGNDPSYQNLPMQNQRSQNLTNGGTITVPLPNVQSVGSAPVYYVVLAQADSQSVSIVGFFRRGEYMYVVVVNNNTICYPDIHMSTLSCIVCFGLLVFVIWQWFVCVTS